ncbi:hypothetical protein C8Q77DRAFT_1053092 [Trametes polyzona]|nr:hypothetical protein C8Q77DRAFT_1053092 [Trametes polyzona]
MELDVRFADVDRLKFYFVTEDAGGQLAREERVRACQNNVHIDTLPAGKLGLPASIPSTFRAGDTDIRILHPSILILTKLKRWSAMHTSTRPQTLRKVASDRSDIQYIITWLADRRERIRFHEYPGKTKLELLGMVRKYHDKFVDDVEQMDKLRSIMSEEWGDMLALPQPTVVSGLPLPPQQ